MLNALRWCLVLVLAKCASGYSADLVPHGASWFYLNPQTMNDDPNDKDNTFDANWFKPNFNVNGANKFLGPAPEPFARATPPSTDSAISAFTPSNSSFVRPAATLIDLPASGERLTSYFRHSFTTTAPANDLGLSILADDGARIYLDGVEVGNLNCCLVELGLPDVVPPGTPTEYVHIARGAGNERAYQTIPLMIGQTLPAGNHVLAVAVHQDRPTSNDMGFSARLIEDFVYRPFVDVGSEWKYRIGDDEPSGGTLDWTTSGFNDASWDSGNDGFGYDTGPDLIDVIQTDIIEAQGVYSSFYLRKKFTVQDPAELTELAVQIDYDDGFVMYINGTEIRRSSFPAGTPGPGESIPFDAFSNDHESSNNGVTPTALLKFNIDLADYPGLLKAGSDNVVAIHGFNVNLGSSDLFIGQVSLAGLGPLPGSGTPGDFDGNGTLDASDIDGLSAAVRAGNNPPQYDVTGDGRVDQADRTLWIEDLKKTWIGDADLNGQFGTADFVAVFISGQFEDATPGNSTWATGDWNGDGDFTTADFVAAFVEGGYEKGPRPAASAVPEPSAVVLLLIGIGCLMRRKLPQE
jgi:hypothetical protein